QPAGLWSRAVSVRVRVPQQRSPCPSSGRRALTDTPFAVVILAAGEGTRMVSRVPKVLHGFAGRSLLGHALAATAPLRAGHTAVVVGHGRDEVTAHLAEI